MTWVGLAVGVLGIVLTWRGALVWGLALWLLNRLLDGLDGALARQNDAQSDFGGYVDILADFVVYAGYPIAIAFAAPSHANSVALAWLLASFYVNAISWSYLAALLEKRQAGASAHGEQTSVTMPEGLIGATETIVFYCLFLLFPQWLVPLFSLMAALVALTILQRLRWARLVLTV